MLAGRNGLEVRIQARKIALQSFVAHPFEQITFGGGDRERDLSSVRCISPLPVASNLASVYQNEAKFADSQTVGPSATVTASAASGIIITLDLEFTSGGFSFIFA